MCVTTYCLRETYGSLGTSYLLNRRGCPPVTMALTWLTILIRLSLWFQLCILFLVRHTQAMVRYSVHGQFRSFAFGWSIGPTFKFSERYSLGVGCNYWVKRTSPRWQSLSQYPLFLFPIRLSRKRTPLVTSFWIALSRAPCQYCEILLVHACHRLSGFREYFR